MSLYAARLPTSGVWLIEILALRGRAQFCQQRASSVSIPGSPRSLSVLFRLDLLLLLRLVFSFISRAPRFLLSGSVGTWTVFAQTESHFQSFRCFLRVVAPPGLRYTWTGFISMRQRQFQKTNLRKKNIRLERKATTYTVKLNLESFSHTSVN